MKECHTRFLLLIDSFTLQCTCHTKTYAELDSSCIVRSVQYLLLISKYLRNQKGLDFSILDLSADCTCFFESCRILTNLDGTNMGRTHQGGRVQHSVREGAFAQISGKHFVESQVVEQSIFPPYYLVGPTREHAKNEVKLWTGGVGRGWEAFGSMPADVGSHGANAPPLICTRGRENQQISDGDIRFCQASCL